MYKEDTITLCIPTLNRYDLLTKCIESAYAGNLKPDTVLVVDNGGYYEYPGSNLVEVKTFGYNIGVAASWNYFIKNTSEIRIISNDDIEFCPDTIKVLVESYNKETIHSVAGVGQLNIFSLFIFPDRLRKEIGLFDEKISPYYGYFEDNDYVYRMKLKNIFCDLSPNVDVGHLGSATLKNMSTSQTSQHHEKFRLAKKNYVKKWGGEPLQEVYTEPHII